MKTTMQCTAKKGPHSRWFDAHASRLVSPLFEQAFGAPVTKEDVRELEIRYVVTLALEDATAPVPVAAVLVEPKHHGVVKLHGVCVDARHRGRGLGTQLMRALETVLPQGTAQVLELCIDTTATAEARRLRAWYERLGFRETAYSDEAAGELCMARRLAPME